MKRATQRTLPLDKATRDSLADYCKMRWPHHTAKLAAREWNLTVDQARGVVDAKSSLNTYDQIKKAGGWPVILAVEAAVVGHGLDQFLARIGASHEHNAERLAALIGGGRAVPAAGLPDPPRVDLGQGDGREPVRRRVG